MFAAILHQMSHNGYQTMSPMELRCATADYMEQHPGRYKPFISFNVNNSMNDTEPVTVEALMIQQIADPHERSERFWCRLLTRLRLKAWGDYTFIQAIAPMFNTTVTILEYRENISNGLLTVIPPYGIIDPLHLGFIPQYHYTSLQKVDDPTNIASEESNSGENSKHKEEFQLKKP